MPKLKEIAKNIFLIFIFYPSMLKILTKLHYHSRFRQSKKFKISSEKQFPIALHLSLY